MKEVCSVLAEVYVPGVECSMILTPIELGEAQRWIRTKSGIESNLERTEVGHQRLCMHSKPSTDKPQGSWHAVAFHFNRSTPASPSITSCKPRSLHAERPRDIPCTRENLADILMGTL